MKALKIVIIILVVLLAIFLIPPLFMPSEMYLEETKVLSAPKEIVWDQVNCLENWEEWDIWHKDTSLVGYYEGPACGKDAKNIWDMKNSDDGGSQVIVESREYEYIKTFLDFREMGTAESEFMFETVEDGTKVTWNFKSDSFEKSLGEAPSRGTTKRAATAGLLSFSPKTILASLSKPLKTATR